MTKQKMINILHFISIVLLPLACWPDGRSMHVMLSKQVLLYAIGILAVLTWALSRFALPSQERRAAENRLLLLYTLFVFLSIFAAQDKAAALLGSQARRDGALMFLTYVCVYFLARRATLRESLLFPALGVSSGLIALLAILQSYQIDPKFLRLYSDAWKGLAFSVLGNPNFLGSFLVLTIPLGLYFIIEGRKWWGYVLYALLFLALLASRTRGSWIGALFAFGAYFFLSREKVGTDRGFARRWMAVCLLSLVLLFFFAFTSSYDFRERVLSIFGDFFNASMGDEQEAVHAGSNRVYIWKKTLQLIARRPLTGYGVENMSYAMREAFYDDVVATFGKFKNFDKAHNEYLHIAVSSGIPSLLVYLGFLAAALKKGFARRSASPAHAFLLASSIGYMVQAFFNIQMLLVYYLFLAFLGILSRETPRPESLPASSVV